MMLFGWLLATATVVSLISWMVGHSILPIFAENASGFRGPYCVSALRYRSLENISVYPIIVPELELRNVK
jgi:hypothetical protein